MINATATPFFPHFLYQELLASLRKNSENYDEQTPKGAIVLAEGESFNVEPGGMLAFKNLEVDTHRSAKGLWPIFKRYILGGETLFLNTFTAKKGGGWLALEENQPGQVVSTPLETGGKGFIIRKGAYLASTPNVLLETKYAGLSGYIQGKGIATTMAKVAEGGGPGRVYFQTPVGIAKKFQVSENNTPITVDNNMILGYTEGLKITIKKIGGIRSLFFSGEGLTCEFEGQGDIYVGSGTQSDGSNALYAFMASTGERIGDWVGKAFFATFLTGSVIYILPEEVKKDLPQVALRLFTKLLEK